MSELKGIKELPESLCELYNLRTLNLSLKKRPQGMGKLINLRHLINDGTDAFSYMPKGIERLVFLRTLSKLVVGGDGDNSQVCSLDCLKKLDFLRGSLVIKGMGNVIDGAEAKKANLMNKKYLLDLQLYFSYDDDDDNDISEGEASSSQCRLQIDEDEASATEVCRKDESVVEALHAPPNLEKLVLRGYRGITMSFEWMGSLTQLRELTLRDCINCEHLPPLGKLPLLERLQIIGMRGLKRVLPNHFLQVTSLERLNIDYCPVFKQWAKIYHHLPITSDSETTRRNFGKALEAIENVIDETRAQFAVRGIYEDLMAYGYIDFTKEYGSH
ncbi:hypothetical protein Ddye_014595 [Dipteronia dyeriana]|uniref:R13L1/DRL21-like LRR repeat region domain-containing protein n=1 Tax=Dipteronia dyeriana TaxID=168575 RepID=A0AAD9X8C2_9ROSI|nr:hypothetical protein Ddye_014595 [Dipteronia dyeriana]